MLDPRIRRVLICNRCFGALAIVLVWSACASSPQTLETPPGLEPPAETSPSQAEDQRAETAESTAERADDDLTVVIDSGDEETTPTQTLLEAAAAERERRRNTEPPAIVITNENLSDYATGELTVVSGGARRAPAEGSETEPVAGDADARDAVGAERYWRQRVLEVRSDWKQTLEEIDHLEGRVAELRRRFYAEDDPYYRDRQIKPSWDRALERLEEARDAAETFRARLDQVLEEGRRAGALPGWLREGIELQPERQIEGESERLEEHQPQEPTVVEEDGLETP
jgi:hypothetical protein